MPCSLDIPVWPALFRRLMEEQWFWRKGEVKWEMGGVEEQRLLSECIE